MTTNANKLDLFKDILPSILEGKNILPSVNKTYNAFIINRALSYHQDTVLLANETNIYPSMSKNMHYFFLINTTKKYKRPFSKWNRYVSDENTKMIMAYYHVSENKARKYLSLLSEEQLQNIKIKMSKGGISNHDEKSNRGKKRLST